MKNYLANLIARHVNKAEILQPRLASRFEPRSSALKTEVLEPDSSVGEVQAADVFGPASANALTEPLVREAAIDRTVESPRVQPSSAETTSDSSGPSLTIFSQPAAARSQGEQLEPPDNVVAKETENKPIVPAELTTPTSAASEPPKQPTASVPSQVHSVSLELSGSETPSEEAPDVHVTSPPPLVRKPRLPTSADQVAVADETEQRMPTESSPAPAQITAKPSPRPAWTKTDQTLTPASPVDSQPQVPQTKTETKKEAAVAVEEHTPVVSSVSPSKRRRSPDQTKIRPSDSPMVDHRSAGTVPVVVTPVPEIVKSPAVNTAEREIQALPRRFERSTEEVDHRQRVPVLETSIVRPPPNNSMSDKGMSRNQMMPVETGPTINVTIGRIEVRAATQGSEARPQKQRREQQVLSLDEYLRQRAAGGR